MLLILFGTPGVGKSYVGQILAEQYDFYLYDADEDLTSDMIAAIRKEEVFTPEMRYEFFEIVIEKIQKLQQRYDNVAVAQALIKEANREQLQQQLPHAQFIYIEAEMENIKQRLKIRDNWVSVEYAEKIRKVFDNPRLSHFLLDNNRDQQHVKQQISHLFASCFGENGSFVK